MFLLIILSISFVYTYFHPIPTDDLAFKKVGIGAELLHIGDRTFYINDNGLDYGYEGMKGNFLYPYLLKFITNITRILGYEINSRLWNLIVITFAAISSFFTLIFLDYTATNIFGRKVAKISSWLFVLCPYTLFYTLSGSLTVYMTLGVSYCTFVLTRSSIFNKNDSNLSPIKSLILLAPGCFFLSSLRPSGGIFSLVILIGLLSYILFNKRKSFYISRKDLFIIYISISILLLYTASQFLLTQEYINFSLNSFTTQKGTFYGVDREYLRYRFSLEGVTVKNLIYNIIWKLTDFVSGISDIRDTVSSYEVTNYDFPLFQFFARICTGIFFLYPLNLLSLIGLTQSINKFFTSGLWLTTLASFIAISPSILGVAQSRYLIMFYPPMLILSAVSIEKLTNQKK
tara:strand:- start:913 stop:2115 length:1203 start_codon:yes stop_codon:yes gene_type:complete